MIYRDFKGEKISALGFGTMRLPVLDGDDSVIDEAETFEMFDYAFENGINYFDTAWGYHSGTSEIVTGKALKRYPRESFKLATKFPGYDVSNFPKAKEIFEEQFERLQVEYFDFYLLHNLSEVNLKYYLDPQYEIKKFFTEQREKGRIRHLGFSSHAGYPAFMEFFNEYKDEMEFCQLQLNWIDWNFQEVYKLAEECNKAGIPLIVMEPLRGGSLLKQDGDLEKSLRFAHNTEGVLTVLSGMSSLEQMKENVALYSNEEKMAPLSDEEKKELFKRAESLTDVIPCTKCHYCTPHCPIGIDIPWLLHLFDEHRYTISQLGAEKAFIAPMAIGGIERGKKPWNCLECGACKAVCPQQIEIPELLAEFSELLKKTR